ncbi:hypothetical protein AKO1_012382, partial [Acrasis kona]
ESLQPVTIQFNPHCIKEIPSYKSTQFDDPPNLENVENKAVDIHIIQHPKLEIKLTGKEHVFDGSAVTVTEPESLWILSPNKPIYDIFNWYLTCVDECVLKSNIYRWSKRDQYWMRQSACEPLDRSLVFGYDDIFDQIEQDMDAISKKEELLKLIGRSSSLNYLLHGPPGYGKTSTIKVIATQNELDVYIASFNGITDESVIQKIMTPIDHGKAILLIEDFDRYMKSQDSNMSAFLNALDGVEPSQGIIRFFTANNPEVIVRNKAFTSRMQRVWRFDRLCEDSTNKRVKQMFEGQPEELVMQFGAEAVKHQLSMRDVTNLLFRNIMKEDGLRKSIEQIPDYLEEREMLINTDNQETVQDKEPTVDARYDY